MFTLPVASVGTCTVMFTSFPSATIPSWDTVALIDEGTLLTLNSALSFAT